MRGRILHMGGVMHVDMGGASMRGSMLRMCGPVPRLEYKLRCHPAAHEGVGPLPTKWTPLPPGFGSVSLVYWLGMMKLTWQGREDVATMPPLQRGRWHACTSCLHAARCPPAVNHTSQASLHPASMATQPRPAPTRYRTHATPPSPPCTRPPPSQPPRGSSSQSWRWRALRSSPG